MGGSISQQRKAVSAQTNGKRWINCKKAGCGMVDSGRRKKPNSTSKEVNHDSSQWSKWNKLKQKR